ncbi:MAG: hypothetical protein A2W91_17760 [Bacteroidetes bacterium GWF2_38_335]|nr:MAG: hypothetical protein A2W91_17760 [Bacteroidetes bacterium GWF2_38_335]OFY78019.1 MAG: hypothetical protein A2281_18700 [Bacteroidetes bacterium RIFOXYA12_FULL_38_20]HBS88291.1 hypothetical protein [Bacteroidales bacterium]
MKICKYGVSLIRLRKEHIELVRTKRNDPKISGFMEYRDYITPEMQEKWFDSINNIYNSYYLIEYENEYIGLINEKNINFEERSSEAGLFIWEEKYLNTYVPLFASLCLLEVGFNILQGEKCYIKVHKDNRNAIDYNIKMGFELLSENPETGFKTLVLKRNGYEDKVRKIIKAARTLAPGKTTSVLVLEKIDFTEGIGHFTQKLLDESPVDFKMKTEGDNLIYYYEWEI